MDLRETVARVIQEGVPWNSGSKETKKAVINFRGVTLNVVYTFDHSKNHYGVEVQEAYTKESIIDLFVKQSDLDALDQTVAREIESKESSENPPEQTQTSMNDGDEPYTPRAKQ